MHPRKLLLALAAAAALMASALPPASATITASVTTPSNVVANPEFNVDGSPWAVAWRYSATISACVPPTPCPQQTEWRVLVGGSSQNGTVTAAALDGSVVATGSDTHTGHGGTTSYSKETTATLTLGTGTHNLKVAVRPILNDPTWAWQVKTITIQVVSSADADGDHVPDAVEGKICGRQDIERIVEALSVAGECLTSTNYAPPALAASLIVPHNVQKGVDQDNDGFPSSVTVYFQRIDVSNAGVGISGAGSSTQVIDHFDADANWPVVSEVCSPQPLPSGVSQGPDGDNDGFPAYSRVSQARVCANRVTQAVTIIPDATVLQVPVDTNDGDANQPVLSEVTVADIPTGARYHHDVDNDGIPAGFTKTLSNVTYNRTTPSQAPRVTTYERFIGVDPDDGDANDPILIMGALDGDQDQVPDLSEAFLCGIEDRNDALDGTCSGTNYAPPSWYRSVIDTLFASF